ncbi:MAG: hypothetical protein JOY99_12965 [Sphingomonadaceae bacterium]|nr:hypothetical protein [Sphingomonadaceae bacterium]
MKRVAAPAGKPWPAEDLAKLQSMAREGASMLDIARALGRTLQDVLAKATKLKIKVTR